jgi:hypothetical protein
MRDHLKTRLAYQRGLQVFDGNTVLESLFGPQPNTFNGKESLAWPVVPLSRG